MKVTRTVNPDSIVYEITDMIIDVSNGNETEASATIVIWESGYVSMMGNNQMVRKFKLRWAELGYPLDLIGGRCG